MAQQASPPREPDVGRGPKVFWRVGFYGRPSGLRWALQFEGLAQAGNRSASEPKVRQICLDGTNSDQI